VVGRVGTILGRLGVNIAAMQVSRRSAGGEALMTLTVDSPIQADVLHEAARDIGAAAASAVDLRDD
jgi:D-3-phosphoglycerate dehydrogenase